MLLTRWVSPSQIGPLALNLRASAQSSISESRMASMPPMSRKISARTSMHPPAAAAVARSPRLTHENGYNIWKKKMNAGMRKRSDLLSQRSLTMKDASKTSREAAWATSQRKILGAITLSAYDKRKYSRGWSRAWATAMPWLSAHSLPVHPEGSGAPDTIVIRFCAPQSDATRRARSAVPSPLLSSTRMTDQGPG